ncbi:MAG: hypothetical protein JWR84_2794 [Caulobacter sp.]|nr:hypothetical protein [Caulobacter sp.]
MDLMFAPLRKYADFTGRARRSEFWLFYLFYFIVACVLGVIGNMVFGPAPTSGAGMYYGGNPLSAIWFLAMLLPILAAGARRLHDTDRSAWWLLLWLVPIIGWIVLIVFYVMDGTPGDNKYGPNPKGATGDGLVG